MMRRGGREERKGGGGWSEKYPQLCEILVEFREIRWPKMGMADKMMRIQITSVEILVCVGKMGGWRWWQWRKNKQTNKLVIFYMIMSCDGFEKSSPGNI